MSKESGAHATSVMGDVLWLELVKFLDHDVVFDEKLAIFFLGTAAVEIPAGGYGVNVKGAKHWLFDLVRDGHVILDGI
jgi:hypothetical protein